MKIIKITSNHHLKQNSYLVLNKSGAILIDSGVSLSEIEYELEKEGIAWDDLKIDAILLTHTHFDHISHLIEISNQFTAPVYVKSGCESFISDPNYNLSFMSDKLLTEKPHTVIPINSENDIIISEIIVKPIFTPGHALCAMCYIIENNLFSGDTLFYKSYGRTDLIGGNEYEVKKSIQKLESIDYTICYPGHGIPFEKKKIKSIK